MATLQVNALFKKAAPAPKKAAPAKKGFGAPKKAAPAPKKTVKKVAPKKVAPKKTIKKAAPVKKSGNLAQAGDDLTKWYGEYPIHPSAPRRATSVRASSPIPRSRCPAILLPPRTPPCLSRRVARARDPDARDAIPPRAGCSSTSPLPTRRDRAPALRIRAAARDRGALATLGCAPAVYTLAKEKQRPSRRGVEDTHAHLHCCHRLPLLSHTDGSAQESAGLRLL